MKVKILIGFVCLVLGFFISYKKIFPYEFIIKLKELVIPPKELGRLSLVDNYEKVKVEVSDSVGIFLTYGQSNAVNHGQIGYEVQEKVYMFFKNETYVYKDPTLGVSGMHGSVWGMVGDKLIKNGQYNQVIFANSGLGGRKIKDLNQGKHFDYLISNYKALIDQFGRVDAILFHQGEAEINPEDIDNYYENFVLFLDNLKKEGVGIPIFLSRTSYCYSARPRLVEIQNQLIKDFDMIYSGPNTDLLTNNIYRTPDNCHFSLLGYDKFADMWIDCLSNSI